MLGASIWRGAVVSANAKIKAMFGQSVGVSNAGRRTNAKFIIACVMQIITLLVMVYRSLMNQISLKL